MLNTTFSLSGNGYTPGMKMPEQSDMVEVYLGDITKAYDPLDLTHVQPFLGVAYVGKDGSLLPVGIWNHGAVARMAPGFYDITVDGLVFKDGLEIKNPFNSSDMAWISIDGKRGDVVYINGSKSHVVQFNARGADSRTLFAGSLELAQDMPNSGRYTLQPNSMTGGKRTMFGTAVWNESNSVLDDILGALGKGGFTVTTQQAFYVQQSLKLSSTSLSASGRTLKLSGKVAGPAEANGSTAFAMKVQFQKKTNGKWKNYGAVKTVAASNGKYAFSYRPASKGTYRAKVSHSDMAHPSSYKYSNSKASK